MRVAEQTGRRLPHDLGRLLCVGVRPVAQRVEPAFAEEAVTTGQVERHDDAIADLELRMALADLDDLAHRFMAEHVAAFHGRHVAVHEMEVGAADRAGGDPDDDVAIVLDARIIDAVAAYVAFSVPAERFHGSDLRSILRGRAGLCELAVLLGLQAGRRDVRCGGLQLVTPAADDLLLARHRRF